MLVNICFSCDRIYFSFKNPYKRGHYTYVSLCVHRDDIRSLEILLDFAYVTFFHAVYGNNLMSKFCHRMYKEIHDYVLTQSKTVVISKNFK